MNNEPKVIKRSPNKLATLHREIAELKKSEAGYKQKVDALQKSEKYFRAITQNSSDIILIVDKKGTITYVNPSVEHFLGYTPEELIGKSGFHFIMPADIPRAIYDFGKAVLAKDVNIPNTFRVRHKDGSEHVLEGVGNNLLGDPTVAGFVMNIRDITERRQAEEELRKYREHLKELVEERTTELRTTNEQLQREFNERTQAEEALRKAEREKSAILDTMTEMVIYLDTDMKVIWSNSAMNHQFNMKSGQIEGRICYEVLHKLNRPCRICPVVKSIETGNPCTVDDFSSLGKRWTMRAYPVRDEEGNLVGMVEIVTDITNRKQAEEALQQSEKKFRDLAELLPQAVFEFDLQGYFTYANRAAFKIFGYSQADLEKGVNALDVIAPADRERAAVNITRISNKDMETGTEYTALRKNGEEFPVIIYSTPIHADEKVIGLRGIVIDFTERKRAEDEKRRLEERLQRAEKMESLGTLAGGVAHDLNNVLGVVLGYAELLLNSVDESSPIKPRLLNIMKGGEKAAAIVQDLLTLARRSVPNRQVLNLNKVIADCQQSPEFEKLSSYHPSVTIKTDLEPDLLNISGSPVHLGKTLFNLVSNASEAIKKGGIVTVKTANQYLDKPIYGYDDVREGDYVVLTVSDTGEGIPKADLKRIFEPFYTKKAMGRSGTGLGLAVVWGTVKDNYGYINVQSEEGKGSIFTLYFPVTRKDIPAEAVALSMSEYMGKGEYILVVDDVKGQRDLAAEMLKTLNYNVTSVSSGEEAVAYLEEHKADLMVLDMIMDPGMDGLDTYRSVLEIHPSQKAIIVSGFSETDRVNAAQSLGAGAYVRKPYVMEKLGLAVRKELVRSM